MKIREKPGRPSLSRDQPLLLKSIVNIAIFGSAAHEKRQSDIYRTVKTLDDLTNQLKADGFSLSRSAVYLRLLPRCSSTNQGKKHVSTVPVKLIRAQNDAHKKHPDGPFCTATIKYLEDIASLLGPNQVCSLSQDDKARVPIGLTAANEQAPMLMHVQYKISLPDHDWVIANEHKLIPSVYAGLTIQNNYFGKSDAVGYSGPTYVSIRSGKHSSSTAKTHAVDFERLLKLSEFDEITKFQGTVKPVVIFTVDGGPDENPRYGKVINHAVQFYCQP